MNVSDFFAKIVQESELAICPICHILYPETNGFYLKEEPEFVVCSTNCAHQYLVDNGDFYKS